MAQSPYKLRVIRDSADGRDFSQLTTADGKVVNGVSQIRTVSTSVDGSTSNLEVTMTLTNVPVEDDAAKPSEPRKGGTKGEATLDDKA